VGQFLLFVQQRVQLGWFVLQPFIVRRLVIPRFVRRRRERIVVTRMPRTVLAALLLLLGFVLPALADPPIPALTGRVVDQAGILDASTIAALTRKLADHESATSDQVVVVTLPDLKGYTIEQWGLALLNGWGIGQRGKDNGVVLVVAPSDRRLRIEVGTGLESVLTNKAAGDIIQAEIIPRFKGGDLKGGVSAGVDAILATVGGTYRAPLVEANGSSGGSRFNIERYLPFGIPLLFVAIVGFNLLLRRHGRTGRRGGFNRGYYDNRSYGPRSDSRSFGGSSGGFSGGGGGGRGGGASGRW
jgi:uncharacterized protein